MPEDTRDPREADKSVNDADAYPKGHATTMGGAMAGALAGAAMGGSTVGLAGAAVGAVTGGAVGAAAERAMHVDDEAEQGTLGEVTWVPPAVEETADKSAYLASRGVPTTAPAPEPPEYDEFQRDDM